MRVLTFKINVTVAASCAVAVGLAGLMLPKKSVEWLWVLSMTLGGLGCLIAFHDAAWPPQKPVGGQTVWRKRDSLWLALTAVLPLVYSVKMALDGPHIPMLKNVLQLLLAWPVFWGVRCTGPNPRWMLWGASTAAVVAAAMTTPQVLAGVERVVLRAIPNPIPLGNFSLLLGTVGGTAWLFRQPLQIPRWQLVWSALGLAAGIWVSMASGSRGGWLALPVLGWVYSLTWSQWRWYHRWGLVLCVLAIGALGAITVPTMQQRFQVGWQEIQQYLQHVDHWQSDQVLGSLDRRLEMWRLGVLAFLQAPWWGLGFTGFDAFVNAYINNGWTHPQVMWHDTTAKHEHLHNEFVTTAARLGLAGLAVLLWFWWGCWRWFQAGLNHPDAKARTYSTIGLLTHSAVVVYSLTDSMFGMTINTALYAVLLGLSAGGLRHTECWKETATQHSPSRG